MRRICNEIIVSAIGGDAPPARIERMAHDLIAAASIKRLPVAVSGSRVIGRFVPGKREETVNGNKRPPVSITLCTPGSRIGLPWPIADHF